MRAVVVPRPGPPEVLEVHDDWPAPATPGPDEVLVAVEASGLNPSDLKLRGGNAAPEMFPYVAGREAAGRILLLGSNVVGSDAVGSPVVGLAEGDPVFAFFGWHARPGGHADQVVIPAAMVARRPEPVPVTDAASLPLAGLTALQALRLLDVPPGGRIAITGGAGGVGVFAVQLAALADWRSRRRPGPPIRGSCGRSARPGPSTTTATTPRPPSRA